VPHPDDEALGCSGTLLQMNRRGCSSAVVFMTNGERLYGEPSLEIADKRKEEAKICSRMIGCVEPIFLGCPDGEVDKHIERAYEQLSAIVKEKKPDIIFAPSPIDYHPDHIATSHISLRLLEAFNFLVVAFYEVYTTVRFNCLIDIGDVVEQKKVAILNYKTSLYGMPRKYVHASLGLNAHRSIFAEKEGYYEAFYIVERSDGLGRIRDYFSYGDLNT
jgi:LmbE family N-acetylglucosaminyl deacetylase